MRKAQSPSDADFIEVYQKAKYGINLIAKLGHHLSNPTAEMLLEGFFVYLREFIKKNKVYVISMQPSLLFFSYGVFIWFTLPFPGHILLPQYRYPC